MANHHLLNAHIRGKKQECQRPVNVVPTSPSMTLLSRPTGSKRSSEIKVCNKKKEHTHTNRKS